MKPLVGRAWCFGDHIDTDVIYPGQYLKFPVEEAAKHVMEGVDPAFPSKIRRGDIIVAGKNFGCGSSRESAPAALKYAGIGAVVAEFFARIFYRNSINLGLPVIECPQAKQIQEGDLLEIDLVKGTIRNLTKNEIYSVTPFPDHVLAILQAGGLVPMLERYVKERERRTW